MKILNELLFPELYIFSDKEYNVLYYNYHLNSQHG